jgi:two-component system chemotaxis response regulator CheV
VDGEMISIIDVERVFADIMGFSEEVSDNVLQGVTDMNSEKPRHVMVVDDSSVARNQVKRVLEKVGIDCTLANDGQEGYEALEKMVADGSTLADKIALVISDVEMPRMDGYTLTTKIRQNPQMKDIYVMLHTSLSGVFNNSMVEKVGANHFVPKFKPNELAHSVINIVNNKDPLDGMDQIADT